MNRKIYVAKCNVGLGIFAKKRFEPGDLILSFAGRRVSQLDPIHLTEEGANLLQIGKHSYIFPSPPGLYANHSCDWLLQFTVIKSYKKFQFIKHDDI